MNISIYGGKDEIGGNKVLLEHEGTKVMLDFGMSFKQHAKYYCEYLQPRKCSALGDFFEFGLLPDLKGIYRQDYLDHMGRGPEEKGIDALFISHAHADHAQYIHFLRPDIPIYTSRQSRTILSALQVTGSGSFSELTDCCDAFKFYKNRSGGLSRVKRGNSDYVCDRPYRVMSPGDVASIGGLDIEMTPVDHSLPGACGFIVHSSDGNLVYTGDIRFHGSNGELSRRFVEQASESKPQWMLSEGTRIDSDRIDSEAGVKRTITELVSREKGAVFVEHPIRDMDRVTSIFDATMENEREFAVSLKLAYLIRAMKNDIPFGLDDVKILVPRKSWGLISKRQVPEDQLMQDYSKWEQELIGLPNAITYEDICKSERDYVVSMNFWEIGQLSDITPKGALWIKSSCEPFCEEMELDERRKENWLRHFGVRQVNAHASGHASGGELRDMIRSISPKELIPIHTEHPEMLLKCNAS